MAEIRFNLKLPSDDLKRLDSIFQKVMSALCRIVLGQKEKTEFQQVSTGL